MRKRKLRISIITPSFNQGEYLGKTISSVLGQSYPNIEYIVMDGGSTDASLNILRSAGSRCIWESQKDNGQSAALNSGIKKSTGDVVAYINSDDYYLPDAIENVMDVFENRPDVTWLVGDSVIVDQAGNLIQPFVRQFKRWVRSWYRPWVLGIINPIPQPAVFLRKKAVDEVGLFSESLHYTMDYEYWVRFQARWGAPYMYPKTLSAFRIHADSKGTQHFSEQFSEELDVGRKHFSSPLLRSLHKLAVTCILTAYKVIK